MVAEPIPAALIE